MKKDTYEGLLAFISVVVLCLAIGYIIGHFKGMDDGIKLTRKVECEVEYSNKTLNEIPLNCLELLNLKELKK